MKTLVALLWMVGACLAQYAGVGGGYGVGGVDGPKWYGPIALPPGYDEHGAPLPVEDTPEVAAVKDALMTTLMRAGGQVHPAPPDPHYQEPAEYGSTGFASSEFGGSGPSSGFGASGHGNFGPGPAAFPSAFGAPSQHNPHFNPRPPPHHHVPVFGR